MYIRLVSPGTRVGRSADDVSSVHVTLKVGTAPRLLEATKGRRPAGDRSWRVSNAFLNLKLQYTLGYTDGTHRGVLCGSDRNAGCLFGINRY